MICAQQAATPRRFNVKILADNLRFNCEFQVEKMWLPENTLVHVVNIATHFTEARFMRNQAPSDIWKMITTMLTLVYQFPWTTFMYIKALTTLLQN